MFAVRTTHTRKDFLGAHVHSEEIQDITTSRVPQARVHQVGDTDGMVVFGLVPAQNGRNVGIRLDFDSAPAPRPFARQLHDPIHALPDVFRLTTGPLARTGINSFLVPKWTVRMTRGRETKLDSVIEFFVDAPRVELFQRVPLVSWTSLFPVLGDASAPSGCRGVDCFDRARKNLNSGSNYRSRRLEWTVTIRKTVGRERAKTAFKGWYSCRS